MGIVGPRIFEGGGQLELWLVHVRIMRVSFH